MTPFHVDRRDGEDRRLKLDEPVSLKVFVGVLIAVISATLLWLSAFAGSSVVTSQRFVLDSIRNENERQNDRRDVRDLRSTGMRTDSTTRCILARLEKRPSPFCQ